MDSVARVNKYVKIALVHQALADSLFFRKPNLEVFKACYLKHGQIIAYGSFYKNETKLIKEVLSRYGITDTSLSAGLNNFVERWKAAQKDTLTSMGWERPKTPMINRFQAALFAKNYREGEKVIELAKDSISNAEIKLFGKRYTKFVLFWFNVTPSISNTSFYYYEIAKNTIGPKNSFLPSIKIALSRYQKYPAVSGKFMLVTASVTPKITNSLEEMTMLSYKQSKPVKVNDSVTVSDDKAGTAYKGNYLRGFGIDAFLEGYWNPWKERFIPGFYAKIGYSFGSPWVNDHQIPCEMGIMYNLKSSVKDAVNLLSIIPYVSWSNLLSSVEYSNSGYYGDIDPSNASY